MMCCKRMGRVEKDLPNKEKLSYEALVVAFKKKTQDFLPFFKTCLYSCSRLFQEFKTLPFEPNPKNYKTKKSKMSINELIIGRYPCPGPLPDFTNTLESTLSL